MVKIPRNISIWGVYGTSHAHKYCLRAVFDTRQLFPALDNCFHCQTAVFDARQALSAQDNCVHWFRRKTAASTAKLQFSMQDNCFRCKTVVFRCKTEGLGGLELLDCRAGALEAAGLACWLTASWTECQGTYEPSCGATRKLAIQAYG